MCSVTAFTIASGITQAAGAIQGASAASAAANAQARQAQQQAEISAIQANQEFRAGVHEERARRSELRRLSGENEAAAGAGGTVAGSGSALDAALANINAAEQDAGIIKYNAANAAYGHEAQAVQFMNQASISRAEAKNAKSAGYLNAFGSILGTAGNVWGMKFAGSNMTNSASKKAAKKVKYMDKSAPINFGWNNPRMYPQFQLS